MQYSRYTPTGYAGEMVRHSGGGRETQTSSIFARVRFPEKNFGVFNKGAKILAYCEQTTLL